VETARANYQSALRNLASSEAGTDIKSGEAAVETAKANYQSALSNLASFEAGTDIKSAEATVESAKASYQSALSNLANLKAGAKASEIRTAEAAIESARASYQRAVTDLAGLNAGVKPADIQQALSQLANAKAVYSQQTGTVSELERQLSREHLRQAQIAVSRSKLTLSQSVVTSPFDGVVASVTANVGEQVSGGSEAAVVADPKSIRIHVDVDETDIPKVEVGQNVTLSIEALPDAELSGIVSSVSPVANVDQGVATYSVTIELNNLDRVFPAGMTVIADIVVVRKDGVLMLPNRAVRRDGEDLFVDVVTAEGTEERKVTTGIRNERFTEILSGLSEGEEVLLRPTRIRSTVTFGG
jgi:HlyD family secretion protein